VLLSQDHLLDVAALPLCQGDRAQGLPVSGTLAEQGVRFQPQLPMPVVSLTIPLHFNSSKLAVTLQRDAHPLGIRKTRLHLFEQDDLYLSIRSAEGRHTPSQRLGSMPKGDCQRQDAPLIFDVRAIQHQPHFGPGPLGEQTAHQWYVAAILSHRLIG
jgi:hypothetical protein